jgi:uncharacterized membrane protein
MIALRILLGIAYPALIYLAVSVAQPRTVAAVAMLLIAARLAFTSPGKLKGYVRALGLPVLAVALILTAAAVWNSPTSLLLTPALVSFALLAVFTRSLAKGQPMAEKFARLQNDDPTDAEIRYCRHVTIVWCAFFLANGLAAAWLAVAADLEIWALYTGFLSYLLVGILFASEFTYRHWRFRRYFGAPTDPLFRRVFPPRARDAEAQPSTRSSITQ